jgi:hypothetical protein
MGLEQAPMMDVMPLDLPDSTLRDVLNLFEILERTRRISFAEAKLEASPTSVSSIIQELTRYHFLTQNYHGNALTFR